MTIKEAANRGIDKIDFLIKNGLGSEQSKLAFYRQIIQNPKQASNSVVMRPYMAEILDNLLKYVFDDNVLYNRLRQLLVASKSKMSAMKPSAFESLVTKYLPIADTVPFEKLIEEYEIGYEDDSRPRHLTKEQFAFNRVNVFIANNGGIKEESKTMSTIKKMIRKKHGTV